MQKSHRRIAVVAACPFPYPRGTPIRILRMAEALTARGHHVEVITYHLGQKMEGLPFPVHRIPRIPTYHKLTPGPTYQKLLILDALLTAKIWSVVRRGRFDLIHAHHYEGLLASLPSARLAKIPLVFDVHTLLSSELPYYNLGLPRAWLRWVGSRLDHWLPPRADHVVAVTHAIRERLIHEIGLADDRVTTIYTGIEAKNFASPPIPGSAAPSALIYTGNLEAYQGIDLMLQALHRVLDQRPDASLKIVTGSPLAPYEPLIDRLDLRGCLEIIPADYFQLPARLYSAQIALSPRVECDGLPVKMLNYMATGRAIVAFEGSAEVIRHGHTGLVVKNGDVEGFASAILSLLADPALAERLGRAARAEVTEFFMWEESARRLEAVYAGLPAA